MFLIRCFSSSKLLEILSAVCKSPRLVFCLYFLGTADDQWLSILDSFNTKDVSVIPFVITIPVWKNIVGFISIANFIFGW